MNPTAEILAGRYRLGPLLGQGGMSDVYEAEDARTGTVVAVKVVRSGDPDLGRRLAQEARALERLRHPGLVRLLDSGFAGSQTYLVMELVLGKPLSDQLRRGPLSPERTATLGADLADALTYVHNQGIIHRDVKPSNILVTSDREVRLGDFGIAKLLDTSTLTVTGTTLGTAAYMAPEQLENHQVGPSADIWSLGMVLVECLTGRRTYEGSPSEVVARRLAGPVPLPNNLPAAWRLILTGMLDQRPEQRLSGPEVTALLATSPFCAPWDVDEPDDPEGLAPTLPHDPAPFAQGLAKTAVLSYPDNSPTALHPRRDKWLRVAALATVVAVGLLAALLLGLRSSPATGHIPVPSAPAQARHSSTTSLPATSTSTPTTTITNAHTALAALVKDVASGIALGSVDPGIGLAITNQAEKAVHDASTGKPSIGANDLQQAAMTITNGVQNGKIAPPEGVSLQTDLSRLAAVLGLTQSSTPPGPQPPGPGHGPGHGHGGG